MALALPDPFVGGPIADGDPKETLKERFDGTQRNFEVIAKSMVETGGRSIGVRFGSTTVVFAAAPEATKAVSHGLGKTPVAAFAFPVLATTQTLFCSARTGASATSITFQFNTDNAVNFTGTVTFYWLVLG